MKLKKYLIPLSILISFGAIAFGFADYPTTKNYETNKIDSLNNQFDPELSKLKSNQLDTFFNNLQKTYRFNGNVLVSQYGHIIYKKSFGFSNIKSKDSLEIDNSFQLASISKQFTAVAILQLVDQGKIKLDESIKAYIPNFPYSAEITIRSLLSHKSGLPNYIYVFDKIIDKRKPLTNQQVVNLFIKHKPAIAYRPNTKFNYCNTNYALLAFIVEDIAKKPFDIYVKENIFEPLEMKNSFVYNPSSPEQLEHSANGYILRGGRLYNAGFDHLDGVMGDKGIYSTVEDMYKWDQGLIQGKIVSRDLLKEAFTPQHTTPKVLTSNYGLGWRLKKLPNDEWLTYHTGWWHGFKNYYLHNEEDNSSIIILGNIAGHALTKLKYAQSILYPEKKQYFIGDEEE